MSLLPTIGAIDQDTGFYNGVATQSLRFAYTTAETWLAKTPDAGNRKTHTLSVWIKRSGLSSGQNILEARGSGDAGNVDIWFDANDRLEVSGGSTYWRTTTRVFRDVSSWYHIMIVTDTVQTGQTFSGQNALRIYVNGVEETVFTDNNHYSEDTDYAIGGNVEHRIGDGYGHFDGYMARYEFVDGIALTPASFGETKNGVWIAKKYTGSYGTNGHKLEFKETGTSANSSGLGADTSGNDNHHTPTQITAIDSNMPDSPENNFCTMNPSGRRYGQSYVSTFSEGSLKVTNADYSSNSNGNSTHNWGTMAINQIASEGGVYFEVRMDALDTNRSYFGVIGDNGTDNKNTAAAGASYSFPIKAVLATSLYLTATTDTDGTSVDLRSGNTVFGNGEVAGVAIKSDGKLFIHREGTYLKDASGNVGNPSTGANPLATIDLTLGDYLPYVGYNSNFTLNFGQDPTFAGNETAPGTDKNDANGIGRFLFDVPTNYLAMCSSNMAEPTIGPNSDTKSSQHFAPKIYSASSGSAGAGSSTPQDIGGLDFKPDLVWIKGRSYTDHHILFDSSRGTGKYILPSTSNAEATQADTLDEFRDDGFGLGADSTALVNYQNNTYVSWNWKGGGGASSNSEGNLASNINANTDAGFSIVTWTGNGNASVTLGHGLNSTPELIIYKGLENTFSWPVWFKTFGTSSGFFLDVNNGAAAAGRVTSVPTPTVIGNVELNYTNTNTEGSVAYCFHSVEGYSKIGTYVANENADGPFIYTGFRPAFVVVKKIDTAHGWEATDAARNTTNPLNKHLLWDTTAGDTTADPYDFYANGFKLKTSGYTRNRVAGKVLLYMAFAEAPFKYANAR